MTVTINVTDSTPEAFEVALEEFKRVLKEEYSNMLFSGSDGTPLRFNTFFDEYQFEDDANEWVKLHVYPTPVKNKDGTTTYLVDSFVQVVKFPVVMEAE